MNFCKLLPLGLHCAEFLFSNKCVNLVVNEIKCNPHLKQLGSLTKLYCRLLPALTLQFLSCKYKIIYCITAITYRHYYTSHAILRYT